MERPRGSSPCRAGPSHRRDWQPCIPLSAIATCSSATCLRTWARPLPSSRVSQWNWGTVCPTCARGRNHSSYPLRAKTVSSVSSRPPRLVDESAPCGCATTICG